MTLMGGTKVVRSYDPVSGAANEVRTGNAIRYIERNALGQPVSVHGSNQPGLRLTWHPDGRLASRSTLLNPLTAPVVETLSYDASGQLRSVSRTSGNAAEAIDRTFHTDERGLITKVQLKTAEGER